jgi:hypothetical protein
LSIYCGRMQQNNLLAKTKIGFNFEKAAA